MSKWFKKYDSSSDEESESISSSESSSESSNTSVDSKEGLKKWLKKAAQDSDDDSTSRDNNIVSRDQKIKDDIIKTKEFFQDDICDIEWEESIYKMKKIVNIFDNIGINDDIIHILESIKRLSLEKDNLTKEGLYHFNKTYKLYNKLINDNDYIIELYKRKKEKKNINESYEYILNNKLNVLLSRNVENIIEESNILIKKSKDFPKIKYTCILLKINEYLSQKLNIQSFKNSYKSIEELLGEISNNNNVIIDSDIKIKEGNSIKLPLILSTLIQILHLKYIKILQNTLPQTEKYNNILAIEPDIFLIYELGISYYEKIKIIEYKRRKCDILLCYLSLIYNKSLQPIEEKRLGKNYKYIIKHSNSDISKSKSTLYYIYSLLVNDHMQKGISELMKSEHYMEHPNGSYYIFTEEIAILYNQVLARLGYLSFINKDIENTFWNLHELCQLDNINMILGQYPVEKKEHLLIPFHQHIDTEVLLELYLISCMLFDNRRSISKLYAAILYKYKNEPLIGDPETLYEKIYKASQFLINGNWKECCDIINTLDYFKNLENDVKQYIFDNIKMTALEFYVQHGQEFYKNIYLQDMIDIFNITYENTISKVSKMITSDKIKAKINHDDGSLNFT